MVARKTSLIRAPAGSVIEYKIDKNALKRLIAPYCAQIVSEISKTGDDNLGIDCDDFLGALYGVISEDKIMRMISPFILVSSHQNTELGELKYLRYKWVLDFSEVFCLELPPQVRTVRILDKLHRITFPWVYLFTVFCEGQFSAFTVFYGKEKIRDLDSPLYFPNMPHGDSWWPYLWCLGVNDFSRSTDTRWVDEVVSAFWERKWRYNAYEKMVQMFCHQSGLACIHTMGGLIKLTKENPEAILKLPWPKASDTVGEFGCKLLFCGYFADYSTQINYKTLIAKNYRQFKNEFRNLLKDALREFDDSIKLPERIRKIHLSREQKECANAIVEGVSASLTGPR